MLIMKTIVDIVAGGSSDFSPPYRWIIHKTPHLFFLPR